MVAILGASMPVQRINTGLYSFDHAFINRDGDIGFPIGKGVEIYGNTFVGKSTIAYGLAGIVAKNIHKDIVLADLEGFDPKFLQTVLANSGFDGNIFCIEEDEDETVLDNLLKKLKDEQYKVGILDSIAAISPIAEVEGEIGEANMGQRALRMAQFSRKALRILRGKEPPTIFAVNHAYPKIGGRGMITPGGEVKNYLFTIRIHVKRKYVKGSYEEYPDGSYIIEGTVVKNRWGLKEKTFNLFVLSGKGIHFGLTAMYDAMSLGLVKKDKRTYKIGGESFGTIREIIHQAHIGNSEFFLPFINILKNPNLMETIEDIDETIKEIEDD